MYDNASGVAGRSSATTLAMIGRIVKKGASSNAEATCYPYEGPDREIHAPLDPLKVLERHP
jgi:hypothetical protein